MKDIKVYPDGNMQCAVFDNFINLQESIAGFGETREKAIIELFKKRDDILLQVIIEDIPHQYQNRLLTLIK